MWTSVVVHANRCDIRNTWDKDEIQRNHGRAERISPIQEQAHVQDIPAQEEPRQEQLQQVKPKEKPREVVLTKVQENNEQLLGYTKETTGAVALPRQNYRTRKGKSIVFVMCCNVLLCSVI